MAQTASYWMKITQGTAEATGTDSFDALFLAEYQSVVAVAYRVLGDAGQAEDVAQDVFCSYYRRHSPDAPYARAWLRQAAAHAALNEIRGRKRRQRREEQDAARSERLVQHDLDPQQAIERDERQREVREALARLPEKSAVALTLRYSGLSYAEVADSLGMKSDQIGTLLRRAEAALRKELTHATRR